MKEDEIVTTALLTIFLLGFRLPGRRSIRVALRTLIATVMPVE